MPDPLRDTFHIVHRPNHRAHVARGSEYILDLDALLPSSVAQHVREQMLSNVDTPSDGRLRIALHPAWAIQRQMVRQ